MICTFSDAKEKPDGIGERGGAEASNDAASLCSKLEQMIIPIFYHERNRFIDIMLHCIALNGSFFNTRRMVQQYVMNACFP
jgi:starch phosphorylase